MKSFPMENKDPHIHIINTLAAFRHKAITWTNVNLSSVSGIIFCMHTANERRRYIVTSFLIGWAHSQNDPCSMVQCHSSEGHFTSHISAINHIKSQNSLENYLTKMPLKSSRVRWNASTHGQSRATYICINGALSSIAIDYWCAKQSGG